MGLKLLGSPLFPAVQVTRLPLGLVRITFTSVVRSSTQNVEGAEELTERRRDAVSEGMSRRGTVAVRARSVRALDRVSREFAGEVNQRR